MGIETVVAIGATLSSVMAAGASAGAGFGALGSALGAIGAVSAVGGAAFAAEQGFQAALGSDSIYGKGYNDPGKPGYDPSRPTVPYQSSAADAAETANAEQTQARRTLLASGGETFLTGPGGAPILGGMTTGKSLLGG